MQQRKMILHIIFVIWSISTIVFFLSRLIPGSPADTILGPDAPQIDKDNWLSRYGLNLPLYQQYFDFLKRLILCDFGKSYANFSDVTIIILPKLLASIKLAIAAFTLSILLALIISTIAVAQQGKLFDKLATIWSFLTISAPSFVIGPILMWIFSVQLNLLPLMGNAEFSGFILPSLTLALPLAAFSSRLIRAELLQVLAQNYIRTAKSKGLAPGAILWKHALRNAFLPTLTVLGLQLGVLLSGTIITEQIFNWPGLGMLILEAVQQREYNIISACVIIMSLIYVLCNFAIDFLYHIFDPRVRLQ